MSTDNCPLEVFVSLRKAMEGHFLCHAEGHDVDAGLIGLTKPHSKIVSLMLTRAEQIVICAETKHLKHAFFTR